MNILISLVLAAEALYAPFNEVDGRTQIVTNQSEALVFNKADTDSVFATNLIEHISQDIKFVAAKDVDIVGEDVVTQDRRIQIGSGAQATGLTKTVDGTNRNQTISIGLNSRASGMTAIAIGSGGKDEETGQLKGAHAEGGSSVAIGYNTYAGSQAIAVGPSAAANKSTSIAIGLRATAYGQYDIALGTDAVVSNWFKSTEVIVTNGEVVVTNTVIATNTYNYAVAIGNGAVVAANGSVQIGKGKNTKGDTIKYQDKYLATENYVEGKINGFATKDYVDSAIEAIGPVRADNSTKGKVEIGYESASKGNGSICIGRGDKSDENATNSIAIGVQNVAHGNDSVVIGYQNISMKESILIGRKIVATNYNAAVGIGNLANPTGYLAIAIGGNAVAGQTNTVAMGQGAKALGKWSTAMGSSAQSTGLKASSYGNEAQASGQSSVAIGDAAKASGKFAIAIGKGDNSAKATAKNSVQIGEGENSTAGTIKFLDKFLATEDKASEIALGYVSVSNATDLVDDNYKNSIAYLVTHQTGTITDVQTNGESAVVDGVANLVGLATTNWVEGHGYATEEWVSGQISATNALFSTAVLSVALNIDTNSAIAITNILSSVDTNIVAELQSLSSAFGGFPIEGTATTVGGLLLMLAAAVAWLKKNKVTAGDGVKEIRIVDNDPGTYEEGVVYFIKGTTT